jgi:hypothetical protein
MVRYRAPMTSRTFALLLALTLSTGCASVRPLPAPEGPPGPALAVAPVSFVLEPTADRETRPVVEPGERAACKACGERQPTSDVARDRCDDCDAAKGFQDPFVEPYVPRFDGRGVTSTVVGTLRKRGTFESVRRLKGKGPVSRKRTKALLAQARKAKAELLLELEVDELAVRFLEYNGWHGPKIAIAILSWILIFPAIDPPNWFIPGEDYGVVASGRWRLRTVESGELTGEGRFEHELCRDSFAAFGLGDIPSREFYFVGFLRAPECLDEADWAEISEQLIDNAEVGLVRALVEVAEGRRKP